MNEENSFVVYWITLPCLTYFKLNCEQTIKIEEAHKFKTKKQALKWHKTKFYWTGDGVVMEIDENNNEIK